MLIVLGALTAALLVLAYITLVMPNASHVDIYLNEERGMDSRRWWPYSLAAVNWRAEQNVAYWRRISTNSSDHLIGVFTHGDVEVIQIQHALLQQHEQPAFSDQDTAQSPQAVGCTRTPSAVYQG
jgi:hypothetical protein